MPHGGPEDRGGGGEICSTTPVTLQGEYGVPERYTFLRVSVGANPQATQAQLDELWEEDLELQICLRYRLGATAHESELAPPWRCPIWLAIPAQDIAVRAEGYMQIHRVSERDDLLLQLWSDTLGQIVGFATTNTDSDTVDGWSTGEFLSFSHIATKFKKLRAGSTSDWAKVFVRLSDVVVEEQLTPTSVSSSALMPSHSCATPSCHP